MRAHARARLSTVVVAGLAAASLTASPAVQKAAVAVPAPLAQILTKYFQFSTSDVASLGRGSTVVKSLPAGESREVAVAGALWCAVPIEFFLQRARDIVAFKKVDEVKQIGVITARATPAALAGLTLEPQDIEDLRRCTPGDCKVKLDDPALLKFRHEVGWATPAATDQANRLAREVVAGYIARYQESGDAALISYHGRDAGATISVAKGTKALLDRVPWLNEAAPGLRQYADTFPRTSLPQAEDVIYWSKEAFGMKPTISATHMTVWRMPGGASEATILSKQIFATHYLEASLSVTLLAGDGRPDHPGVFVVYLNRSLVDLLQGGLLGPFRRSVARSKTRGGVEDHMVAMKKRIEADYKTPKRP